jgi:hypothetical protein
MKKLFAATVAVVALSNTAAYAGCTADELGAKAKAVSDKITELAQKDPQKASDWSQKMVAQQTGVNPQNMDEVCKLYDDMLASLPK